jgi:Ca2+-binding RTX toxin-like protein
VGSATSNSLYGEGGDDNLAGRGGSDWLYGGNGTDSTNYAESGAAVSIMLDRGDGYSDCHGGDAEGDRLFSVENVGGSRFADTLTGDAGANVLSGMAGDDALIGGDGNDVLRGGAGADYLNGGAGGDTASYYTGTAGVAVNLAAGTGSGGEAQGDILTGIETLSGSQGNDSLVGNTVANVLQGWNGNDVLTGAGGKDTLTGGAGADRFVYGSAAQSPVGAAADRITDFSRAQGDRIDLMGIDANTGAIGDQAFRFIGAGAYTHHAGELRTAIVGGVTTIAGDVNGDGVSDFHIQLTGTIGLAAADFVL